MKIKQNLVLKSNLKILSPHIIISAIFLIAVSIITIFFIGENLSIEFMSERVMVLTGILLYTPLFSAEHVENLHEVIVAKLTTYRYIIYIRYVCVSVVLSAVILVYVLLNINKIATVWITLVNTFCISLFLGSIGLVFARVTKKTVLGYMTAFGIYMISMFGEITYNESLIFPPVGQVNINLVIIFVITLVLSMLSLCKIKNMVHQKTIGLSMV